MLASPADKPFSGKDWIFEVKWDGYRAVAEVKDQLKLYSRNGLNFAGKYPAVFNDLRLQQHEMILDGEIIVLNEKGLPDFQYLQGYADNPAAPIEYQVFDLLYLNGHSTEGLTVMERKELLKDALVQTDVIRYCDHVEDEGEKFFEAVAAKDMEGLIAKRKTSTYQEGRRSKDWLKLKFHNTDDAIIIGYTEPQGGRTGFGSLILARQDEEGRLIYEGHTGTGFDERKIKEVLSLLEPLQTKECPIKPVPKTNTKATWVQPQLVCQVKFREVTSDGSFRHPVFLGMREDKEPNEVQETEVTTPAETAREEKTTIMKKAPKKVAETENDRIIKVGKQEVKLSNQNKIYWSDEGYTKGDAVAYYEKMAGYILPYLKDRPESLNRFPNGINGPSFYQKDAGDGTPDWVKTVPMHSDSGDKDIDYIICNDKATLLYLANLGCIEMNPWNSTVKKPDNPTYMIIDIDPSDKNTFEDVIDVALATKEVLDNCGAVSYPKTSGSTGIHIYVPMGNKYDYDQVKNFGNIVALQVLDLVPSIGSVERNLKKRGDKIYIDYLQNRRGQTIASAYSLRPKKGATASAPLEWKEVKKGLKPSMFDIHTLPERVAQIGDIFAPVLGKGIDLLKCLEKMQG